MTTSFPYRLTGLLLFLGLCSGLASCGAPFQRHAPVSPSGYAAFEHHGVHPVVDAAEERTAIVGLSRDRASYTIARHYLEAGRWPPAAAVRVEDFLAALADGDTSEVQTSWIESSIRASPFRPGWHVLVLRISAARLGWTPERVGPIVVSDREGGLEATFARWGVPVRRGGLEDLEHEGPVILVSSGAGLGGPETQRGLLARAAEQRRQGPVSVVGRLEGGLDDALLDALAGAGGGTYEVMRTDQTGAFDALVERLLRPAVAMEARLEVGFEGVRRWRLVGYESTSPAPWTGEVRGASLTGDAVHVVFELDLGRQPESADGASLGGGEGVAVDGGAVKLGMVALEARPAGAGGLRRMEPVALRPTAGEALHARVALIAMTAEVLRGSYWSKDVDLRTLRAEAQRLGHADLLKLIDLVEEAAPTGARSVRPSRRESPLP